MSSNGVSFSDELLFKDIDEFGLKSIGVYEQRGGYGELKRVLRDEYWQGRSASV